jgi:hypothetical protein
LTWPPDRYEGTLVLPEATASAAPPALDEPSAFDRVAAAFERLYEREPRLTRDLLNELRAASPASACDWSGSVCQALARK